MSIVRECASPVVTSGGTRYLGPISISEFLSGSFQCPAAITAVNCNFLVSNRDHVEYNQSGVAQFGTVDGGAPVNVPVAVNRNVQIPVDCFKYRFLLVDLLVVESNNNQFHFALKG